MADKYTTPAFGIPDRFKTPEQEHQERTSALEGKAVSGGNTWIPGGEFVNTLAASTASSFFGGFAGDAKTLDYVFDADITKDAHHSLRNISDSINQWKPDRAKEAGEKKFFTDDGANVGEAWGDIYAYAELAGSGIGSIAALILGGGLLKIVGKGAVKGAVAGSMKKKTDDLLRENADMTREQAESLVKKNSIDYAEKYDSAIGTAAYGTAETAIVSGSVGQSIEEEVMRAPAEVLNTSERFREIYYDLKDNNDISHDEAHNSARVQLSREAGIQGAKTVAIPSALLGSIAGRYIDKAISGRLTKSTLANFGILEAVEMPTEGAQGATEQYVQNKVYKELVDKTRSVWSGVADSSVREALGVAFGVGPLAAISAKVEADIAKGIPPTTDRLTGNEELTIIDHAIKVDEIATVELLERTADDPQARMQGLMDIIEKGNAGKSDPIPESSPEDDLDMDLDLDEAEVARQAAEDGPDVPDLADPFGEEDVPTPVADTEGPEAPTEETPTGPTGPIVGDIQPESQKDLDEGATEPVEDTGWASATANEFQTKRPEFNGLILSFKPGDQRNEQVAAHYYGEIKDTIDKDGMEKDVILNKDYNADTETPIFIVNQMDWDTGDFRQHKIMAGFDTIEEAQQGYIDQFDAKGFGAINEISQEEFTTWKQEDGQTPYSPKSAGNLVVAGIGKDGKTYIGGPGDLHFNLVDKFFPESLTTGESAFDDMGFADPDGNYLTRDEALTYALEENPDFEGVNRQSDLDADDYNKYVRGDFESSADKTRRGEPFDLGGYANLERIPANNIAKALGVKTMTSRANLNDRVAQVAAFLENPTAEGLTAINQFLKTPFRLDGMTPEEIQALVTTTATAMREALANVDTTAPEGETETPEPPKGDVTPEPPSKPETPEVPEGTAPDDEGPTTPEPPAPGPTGGDVDGGTGGDIEVPPPVDKPVDKPAEETPEPTAEEIAEQEAKDAAAIANREAISEVLAELEPGMKAIIRGTTLTGERVMNPETLELVSETNGIYMMSRGKQRKKIILEDGNYYLTSLSNKRSRLITEIERKKQLIQGEAGGNVGGTIRRPHEIWKNDPKTLDDAEKYLVMIGKVTSHAAYVKSVNYADKTHGVKRLYTDILATVPPFLKWIAPHIGSEHGFTKPKDAVLAILRNQPLTQFDSKNRVNIQTPEELAAVVDNYVEMMTELADLVAGTTNIKQLRNQYARNIFTQEPTVEGQVKIDDILALDDAEYELQYRNFARGHWQEREELKKGIVPEYKTEGSLANKYPELFPKTTFDAMHHDYKSRIEFENTSDEKLKPNVPRERRKLSELSAARNGMPDHRKGKQITSEELVETFGFHGVTYGGWVSDVHLEGELSEMQQYNNLVYDSFADLAYLTGLPIKAMGKGLYLSIGAAGHGKSTGLAFFHPSYKKIDVTDDETEQNISDLRDILVNNDVSYLETDNAKTLLKKVEKVMLRDDAVVTRVRVIQFNKEQGDGTFAHEWSHNFGNILNRVEKGIAESLKERPSIFGLHRFIKRAINRYIKSQTDQYDNDELLINLKDELEAVLTYSTEFNKPTSYMKNATFMDLKAPRPGGKKYWSNDQELFARATEAFIHDAILAEGDGASNPFLQSLTAADGAITPANGYLAAIYPEAEERQYFNAFMKKMYSDTISTEDGSIDFEQDGETFDLEFGIQAEFESIKKDYLANLDSMLQQAEDARLERLLSEDADEEIDPLEGLSDDDLLEGFGGKQEELPEVKDKPPGTKTGGKSGPKKPGTVTGEGAGLGSTPRKPKTAEDLIKDFDKLGHNLDETDKTFLDEMLKGGGVDDGTRFSMNIEDFGDTRFSVETVQDRNPDLDPVTYAKWARFMSRRWAEFLDAGNRSFPDFGRAIQETLGKSMAQYQPYILQFMKDVRDGKINYRDYVDTPDSGADGAGEGLDEGADGPRTDEPGDVQQPTDEQTDPVDVSGTATPGTAETSPDGEGAGTGTDLDNAGDNALAKLSPQELSDWIQKETGLRSPSVEPLPSNLGVEGAQVKKKAIAKVRDYENEYQVPTSMSENMENSILRLSDIIEGEGYEGLDDYVMKQLGYTDPEVFENAFMSLQVEAIAAAIYQMSARRRSIIIADQTGVGKGRQAGALIRWAIKQGKVPVFVTENDSLYTDMFYDMADSGIDDVKPFITNTGVGIKSRDVDEDEMAQVEHEGGKVPMLHKLPNKKTTQLTKDMADTGKMPSGTNAVFTTYAQMNTVNTRREALTKLAENNEVVLILDESHIPAKYDPNPRRTTQNRNEYFTQLIRDAESTTYLSATFAKNPENLAFYFNTDLADAMDGMKQLVDVLSAGGVQLQEVMSRALTRNGQLFRREISYDGIEIKTQFGPKDRSKADAYNKRDKEFTNKLTGVIQKLLPVNNQIVNALAKQWGRDPMGLANLLHAKQEINDTEYERIQTGAQNNAQIKINFIPAANQIHNLTDQILVASKADLAVDAILDDIQNELKPIIGLDRTNMAMLNEYITRTDKVVGDDMSDLNWAGLLGFWANKSFNVTISVGENQKESEKIRANVGEDSPGVDSEAVAALNNVKQEAIKVLTDINLPLSPIDYIAQTAERRAQEELGKNINIAEITGRYMGDYGIDYTGDKPILYKVSKFHKRDVIDAFNGEVKDADNNKIPSTVDGMIINQSGSTGVSLHSSEKHGDRTERHMTIVEPAGNINVFQQMLGRIFRTGMGETVPHYTILASEIPADARKINVLLKKMESLNAQTSSNREGSAGVEIEDILNTYGDDVVNEWVQGNQEFQDIFPQWRKKIGHDRGLAYWVTGKIGLFPYEYQQAFYKEVGATYAQVKKDAIADGTWTLEEKFYDKWEAEYLEEYVLAEPRKDGTGFNSGAWLTKLRVQSDFKAMTPDEVKAGIEEGKKIDLAIDAEKAEGVRDIISKLKDSTITELEALAPDGDPATVDGHISRVFKRYRDSWRMMLDASLHEILGDEYPSEQRRPTEVRHAGTREWIDDNRQRVMDSLPKGTRTKFQDLERTLNRIIKQGVRKATQEMAIEGWDIGKTYQFTIGKGDESFSTTGTILSMNRLNNSTDPYVMGDIEMVIAANKPGGTESDGTIKRTLGQAATWGVNPVREWAYGTPDVDAVLKKYHETLAETSKTKDEWVAIGNPLIAASELAAGGQYMQFQDKYGRRMFGIKMRKAQVDQGIEGMILGNLEIPSEIEKSTLGGGKIIVDYIKENPHSELSRKFGFMTRGGNVRVKLDKETTDGIRVEFDTKTAKEKADDPALLNMLDVLGIQMIEFEDDFVFTVPFDNARPVINQILRRSRLVVPGSMKYQLKNYMNISGATKAGENKISIVPPDQVKTYVFEKDNRTITAHRGEYKTRAQKQSGEDGYDGFYMEGLSRWQDLEDLAKMTMMKAKEGEHEGRPFFRIDEFVRGNVQNGRNGKKGLGKPVLGQSIKQDGTSFKLGMPEPARVSAVKAEAQLDSMPARLMRITKVVQSEDQLPAPVKAKIATRKIWGQVRGVFHAGKLYIIADNLSTPEQAMIVFLHEAIGHYGLRKLMGDDLKGLLDQVGALYPEKMRELAAAYKVDIKTDKGWYEIAEEVLAHAAEAGDNRTLMNKIVSMMRQLVRKLGFNLTLNETDVKNILNKSRVAAENGGFDLAGGNVVQPTPMFSIKSSTASETGLDPQIPEDTVAQGIKDGQPVDAIFRGLWGLAELTQVPKLVKYTSSQSLRGAMNFYDNHMPWAHSTMQYMAKGLIDQYGLDDQYKQLKASTAAMKAEIIDEVRDIIEVLEGMGVTDADAKVIHEILTKEEPRQEAWDAVTEPIRQRIEELGQKAVDLGLISQESYDRNKGMYLHRVYQKYEQNRSGLEKWADNLSGKRAKKIEGKETMERGLSYFVGINRIVEDTGLTSEELIVDGQGATIYKISQMSDNGQKALRVYYSLKPFEQAGYKSEKFTIRAKHAGRVKLHRDWTKQEREDMGQITDARYVLGKTYSLLAHDLSTGEFFQKIAANEAWTLPVEQEGDVEVMDGASALHKGGIVTGAEWVRVPTTGIKKSQAKVYGALSGRVVRAEIFQDLNQLNKMQQGSIWKAILTSFKLNKTARNPVVHFNNIMSNLVLMDMADVRFSDLYHAIREMRGKGKLYQEAKRNGAFGVSFAEHELQNEVLDKLLDEIHDAVGAKPVGLSDVFLSMDSLPLNKQFAFLAKIADTLWHGVDIKGKKVGLKNLDKKMLNYYQHEDEVFRMATYMRRKSQGMDEVAAGLSARDQFLNYDINAPWINALRATIMPFLSYTYRAVPIVAKSIAQRPWKLAKYFTIAYGMNAIAYALTGSDEEKERRSLRTEASGKLWIGSDRLIRMPWNDEENNPYFWDVRRLIPVGDVFDMNQYHAALPIIPASLMPSGPIAMGFEFVLNKTGFFGEEIVDPLADDWVISTEKTLDWLWKSYGPSAPWIPYSYYWDKIGIATTGGRDRLGREYDVLPALASSFGIKIAPHDVSYGMAMKAMEIERTVEAVRHKLNFLEKDYWQHKISKDSYEATRKRYIMRLEHLEEKARELVGG